MKTNRRRFLTLAGASLGTLSAHRQMLAAEKAAATKSFAGQPAMRLGIVTYNIAQDWDIPTIIRNCEQAGFQGVELRATHAHGVEVTLSKEQRAAVKRQFQKSKVELTSLGSAFDYHTSDQAKLRKDIEATKEYILLAKEVGATGVKVRPNALPKEVAKEKTLEQIGKALREVGEFAAGHGQQIRLEVHGAQTSLLPNIKIIMDVADHQSVGVCWNSNQTDLEGEGFDHNFNLVKDKIFQVHLRDLFLEEYPFRRLFGRLNEVHYTGYCLAEIPSSTDPVRVMRYFRALWLAYQNLL